jgi:hypothetical protein
MATTTGAVGAAPLSCSRDDDPTAWDLPIGGPVR